MEPTCDLFILSELSYYPTISRAKIPTEYNRLSPVAIWNQFYLILALQRCSGMLQAIEAEVVAIPQPQVAIERVVAYSI